MSRKVINVVSGVKSNFCLNINIPYTLIAEQEIVELSKEELELILGIKLETFVSERFNIYCANLRYSMLNEDNMGYFFNIPAIAYTITAVDETMSLYKFEFNSYADGDVPKIKLSILLNADGTLDLAQIEIKNNQ